MNKSKPKLSFLVSLTASLLTAGYLTLAVDTPDQRINQGKADLYKSYQEGQVLVIFEKGVRAEAVRTLASSRAFRIAKEFKTLSRLTGKQYVWLISAGKSTQPMMQELQQVRGIEKTEANYFVFTDAVPNDTLFPQMWQLNNTGQMGGTVDADIDAPEAWNVTAGSASVIIADVDTGADYGHPDLKSSMWVNPAEISGNGFDDDGNGYVDDVYGINAITGSGDPLDDSGHGSHTNYCHPDLQSKMSINPGEIAGNGKDGDTGFIDEIYGINAGTNTGAPLDDQGNGTHSVETNTAAGKMVKG